jgi:hypothetical protein
LNGDGDIGDCVQSYVLIDTDLDGYAGSADCDDTNASVNPGMAEIPGNGVDDNCNGQADETE